MKHVNLIFICVLLSIISYQAIKIKTKKTIDDYDYDLLAEKCERKHSLWYKGSKFVLHKEYCEYWDSDCDLLNYCGTQIVPDKNIGIFKPPKIRK